MKVDKVIKRKKEGTVVSAYVKKAGKPRVKKIILAANKITVDMETTTCAVGLPPERGGDTCSY